MPKTIGTAKQIRRDRKGRFTPGGAGGPGRSLQHSDPQQFARAVERYLESADPPTWHGLGHHFGFVHGESFRRYMTKPGYREALLRAQIDIAQARRRSFNFTDAGMRQILAHIERKQAELARCEAETTSVLSGNK